MAVEAQLDTPALQALAALVRKHTGIAMNERKRVLLEGRLLPRLRQLGLPSFSAYITHLRSGGSEVQTFINMVTTNDTAFFRTPAVWSYLAERFLPTWHAQHPGQRLRIWSAAAASGEEAYSLAMLCQEFTDTHPGFRFQVHATDIDTTMIAACRQARYSGRIARLFEDQYPQRAGRFARRDGDSLVMADELRQPLQFSQHNLLSPWSGQAPFDLVLLRNVLIYFDEPTQRSVLSHVRRHMTGDARLIVGEQETLSRLGTPLVFEQPHVYARGADA